MLQEKTVLIIARCLFIENSGKEENLLLWLSLLVDFGQVPRRVFSVKLKELIKKDATCIKYWFNKGVNCSCNCILCITNL